MNTTDVKQGQNLEAEDRYTRLTPISEVEAKNNYDKSTK